METGHPFIVSSERLEEQTTEPVTLGLQVQNANHCAMLALTIVSNNRLEC